MNIIDRLLIIDLPERQSAFLWGARKTGKSTYLKAKYPNATFYDLLKADNYLRLLSEPHLLREEILALPKKQLHLPIIIDEIQKIPALLDEVHWLIENTSAKFILCGSSARKLKRGAANLLGGRAWRFEFFPLLYSEIENFNLLQVFNRGLIPSHYLSQHYKKSLMSYLQDYLLEEIKAESLVRNLPAFSRFIEAASYSDTEKTNYTNIARDCAVDKNTVKKYYQILIDTLMGYFIHPFNIENKRSDLSAAPKFYLFDIGLSNFISKTSIQALKGAPAGKSFEQFIFLELIAYRSLNSYYFDITYWNNNKGLEVDFILGKAEVAIEVKISDSPRLSELKGLAAFKEAHPECKAYVACQAPRARKLNLKNGDYITILPWQKFLTMLWGNHFNLE
jgi:uncharacterized protein